MIYKFKLESIDLTSKVALTKFLSDKNITIPEPRSNDSRTENIKLIDTFVENLHDKLVHKILVYFDTKNLHRIKKPETLKRTLKNRMLEFLKDDTVTNIDSDGVSENESESEEDEEKMQSSYTSCNQNHVVSPDNNSSPNLKGSFYSQNNKPIIANLETELTTSPNQKMSAKENILMLESASNILEKESVFKTAGTNQPIVHNNTDVSKIKNPPLLNNSIQNPYKNPKKRSIFGPEGLFDQKVRKLSGNNLAIEISRSKFSNFNGKSMYVVMIVLKEQHTGEPFWCFHGRSFEVFFNTLGSIGEADEIKSHFIPLRSYSLRKNRHTNVAFTSKDRYPKQFIGGILTHKNIGVSEDVEFALLVDEIQEILKDEGFFKHYKMCVKRTVNQGNSTKYLDMLQANYDAGKGFKLLENAEVIVNEDVPLNKFFLDEDILNIMTHLYPDDHILHLPWIEGLQDIAGCENPNISKKYKH